MVIDGWRMDQGANLRRGWSLQQQFDV